MHTWQQQRRSILLASASPRRSEILLQMGVQFSVVPGAGVDEASYMDTADIHGSIARLSVAKGASVAIENPEALVLSADTIVVCDTTILGKPRTKDDAAAMLGMLSGQVHRVKTAVTLACSACGFSETTVATTNVSFRQLHSDEIAWYLESGEATDKAGAYGIQGKAMIFVDKIEGCFYNVVGLPVTGTIDLFKAFDAKGTQ